MTGVSTEEYFKGKAVAPRPLNSALELEKIKATGFVPPLSSERLREYLGATVSQH